MPLRNPNPSIFPESSYPRRMAEKAIQTLAVCQANRQLAGEKKVSRSPKCKTKSQVQDEVPSARRSPKCKTKSQVQDDEVAIHPAKHRPKRCAIETSALVRSRKRHRGDSFALTRAPRLPNPAELRFSQDSDPELPHVVGAKRHVFHCGHTVLRIVPRSWLAAIA